MSERDLLPRKPFAVLPPEPGGFEAALARGRQRRRRTAGSSVLASVVVLALAVALNAPNPNGSAQLQFVKPPVSDLTGEVESPVVDDAGPQAVEFDEPARAVDSVGGFTRPTRLEPENAAAPAPAAPPPARRSAPRRGRTLADPDKSTYPQGHATCAAGENLQVTAQWCLRAFRTSDPESLDSVVSLDVCLSFNVPNATLNFGNSKLVDFVVTRDGSDEELWRWSHGGVPKPTPVRDTVSRGNCLSYSVPWKERVDNNNQLIVEAGTYLLTATSFAKELGSANTATYTFTIDEDR